MIGVPPTLSAEHMLPRLRLCARVYDVFGEDVRVRPDRDSTGGKRRPLKGRATADLERLALDGDDDALIELVRRDKGYVHTDLVRAKVWYWNWQRWWGMDPMTWGDDPVKNSRVSRHAATAKLVQLGEALAFGHGRKARWNAGLVMRCYELAKSRVHRARAALWANPHLTAADLVTEYRVHALVAQNLVPGTPNRPSTQQSVWMEMSCDAVASTESWELMRKLYRHARRQLGTRWEKAMGRENKSL